MLAKSGLMSQKKAEEMALKVLKDYKKRYKDKIKQGVPKGKALDEILNDKKDLVNRVKNSATYEIGKEVRKVYKGQRFRWLASGAKVPDPEHQLNYGKTFKVGEHKYQGREINTDGCQCGMEILTNDEETLYLEDEI